jgi:4-diphosphocytidyl-2-C-methyl-D-erythritol kinase
MTSRDTAESVTAPAPAKVNLRLRILAREEGGYHGLETLFQAVSLCDEVTVRRASPGISLAVDGDVETGPPAENLVARAAAAFYGAARRDAAVAIHLVKRIPSAAGLGGGSSDAAATLRALNALYGEPLPGADLLQIAIGLGSDVPFFLCGSPYALAWSRGERLLALPPLPPRPVLVAHPGVAMPTGEAFRRVAESRGGGYVPRAESFSIQSVGSWDDVAALAANDFQPGAFAAIPVLPRAEAAMRECGASITLLSGSGASLFGIFADEAARDRAEQHVAALGMATWKAATLTSEVPLRVDFRSADG